MRPISCVLVIAALSGCNNEAQITQPPAPLTRLASNIQYAVTNLPTVPGGGTSQGGGINNQGWVAGFVGLTGGIRQNGEERGKRPASSAIRPAKMAAIVPSSIILP
jgi:hypothetical protein